MKCRGKELEFGDNTHIMGVLNITPDSFSDGGKYLNLDNAITHARKMVADGATIIDIGGESSRPGAEQVSETEELDRVLPVIKALDSEGLDVILSIDTTKAVVAKEAIESGAHIINDITALRGDDNMGRVAADMEAAVILMHMQGTPPTMQRAPKYIDVVQEVYQALEKWIDEATRTGIDSDKIIIDPGIGFGKTAEQNLQLIKKLEEFRHLNKPILIGTSRKSFIGSVLNLSLTDRVEGTLATVCWAITHGADIVRVHDVKETFRAARMTDVLHR